MGVRFHRTIRLLPFLYLNIAKSGFSFSLGCPGAALNIGAKGVRGSVGIPGTGLSYRKTLSGKSKKKGKQAAPADTTMETNTLGTQDMENGGGLRVSWRAIGVVALIVVAGFVFTLLRAA